MCYLETEGIQNIQHQKDTTSLVIQINTYKQLQNNRNIFLFLFWWNSYCLTGD